jgi:hypothetical protein
MSRVSAIVSAANDSFRILKASESGIPVIKSMVIRNNMLNAERVINMSKLFKIHHPSGLISYSLP